MLSNEPGADMFAVPTMIMWFSVTKGRLMLCRSIVNTLCLACRVSMGTMVAVLLAKQIDMALLLSNTLLMDLSSFGWLFVLLAGCLVQTKHIVYVTNTI